jgi:hypothetical protein
MCDICTVHMYCTVLYCRKKAVCTWVSLPFWS